MTLKFLKRDAFHLGYLDTGDKSKTPVFVLGSYLYYSRLFSHKLFKNLHLIFLDHRAFAIPNNGRNSYDLQKIVFDIEALRKTLGYSSIYILGHSANGYIAMEYGKNFRHNLKGLILSNLAASNSGSSYELNLKYFKEQAEDERIKSFYSDYDRLENDLIRYPKEAFNRLGIRLKSMTYYDFNFDNSYLFQGVKNNTEAIDYLWDQVFRDYNTRLSLLFLRQKLDIILILGKYDYLTGPASSWNPLLKELEIRSFIIDKSGHYPMLEQAKDYYRILNNFIK